MRSKTSHPEIENIKPESSVTRKKFPRILIPVVATIVIGCSILAYFLLKPHAEDTIPTTDSSEPIYSLLTGEEISDASLNHSPTYCVQIPNGNDGGRPQAGLGQAAVVFEAIAERGITRFAAIFQNPTVSAIGPIRSLRPYYLNWDTPFDCTVVHAGGSDEALSNIARGGQRNLDESLTYMWREDHSDRKWNNLFTSPAKLAEFNQSKGYNTSNPQVFPRLSPNEAQAIIDRRNQPCDEAGTSCPAAETVVQEIHLNFGASPTFNLVYRYDPTVNKYLRAYANGEAHTSYECPASLSEPNTKTQCGDPIQLAPSVVIAMVVQERLDSDQYHESITTNSTGSATIFQNGQAIEGTWTKTAGNSQIVFRDTAGAEVKFTPGQVWISAIPQYGRIEY